MNGFITGITAVKFLTKREVTRLQYALNKLSALMTTNFI